VSGTALETRERWKEKPMDHTIVHFEIPADNPARALKFYRELFGWDIQKFDSEGGPEYWLISTVPRDAKGQPARPGVNGGLMRRQHPAHPPVNYIGVESVDEYVRKAKGLGAEEYMAKTPVKGMGWFAYLKDPEGNVFAIWETDAKAA
jgi:predicted enzyme related to lactoylglutathione lyase